MNGLKARCGSCEHIWDISEYGFKACPQCGSQRVDVASNPGNATSLRPPDTFLVQIRPVGTQTANPSFTDFAKQNNIKRPQGVLLAVVWILICAVAAGLFMGLTVPAAMLSIKLMLFVSGVIMVAKLGLVLMIRNLVSSDSFKLGGAPLSLTQLVGYCFLDIAIWIGIAMLLVIWWPTAAVCFLLIYAAHGCIVILSILSEAILKLRVNVLMVVVYSVMVSAFGHHFLNYFAVG
jgi:hypothetical protein